LQIIESTRIPVCELQFVTGGSISAFWVAWRFVCNIIELYRKQDWGQYSFLGWRSSCLVRDWQFLYCI